MGEGVEAIMIWKTIHGQIQVNLYEVIFTFMSELTLFHPPREYW